tara:strand:- start:6064 stop:7548 length:1485 start_codon:yes stop_codon:yes gene_type:complete
MIISKSKKFIFLKTRKTAGSSIQVSLSTICDSSQDIITGSNKKGEKISEEGYAGWNYKKFFTYHPHPPIDQVKNWVGKDWDDYYKFAFVRNPFDIVVSRYHWDVKAKGNQPTSVEGFNEWIKGYCTPKGTYWQDEQWKYIYVDNKKELDFIGKYENLNEDYNLICNKLGVNPPELGFQKSGFRDKTHYSKFYNEESISLVNQYFKKDLELFNYRFENVKDFKLIDPKSIINKNVINDNNINGPSLIKVPDFIKNKLGKYYLYFANHLGKNIRMAYSDNLEGPWTLHQPGTLQLEDTFCRGHIASPDIHIEDDQIIMYYHGDIGDGQYTLKATSKDGINFTTDDNKLGLFYFRVFDYLGETYAIAKNRNVDGIIYKKENDSFKPLFNLIDNIRHSAIYVDKNILYIFYSKVGEAPESLYICVIKDWEIISNYKFKEPEYDWEGSKQPKNNSRFGMALGFVNELRDPCIFKENEDLYLLYSYGGESGIAIGKLIKT